MTEGNSDGGKTFIIHPEKKTFDIRGESGPFQSQAVHTKVFTITSERYPVRLPGTNREIMFAHQRNDSDCGACLVLNILSVLSKPALLNTITDIRRLNNDLRIAQHNQALGDNEWFLTSDVSQLLESQGLHVEPYSVKSQLQESDFNESLQRKIRSGGAFVVCSGTGRHFKGIYTNDGQHYYEIDSLKKTITEVSQDTVSLLVTLAKTSDRTETVAIVF